MTELGTSVQKYF